MEKSVKHEKLVKQKRKMVKWKNWKMEKMVKQKIWLN